MVLSDGKLSPSLVSSHLIAETPVCAKRSASNRLLIEAMSCLSASRVFVGLPSGALGLSWYQSSCPVLKRLHHLKNHFFERFRSPYIALGSSPLRCLWIAVFRISSSTGPPPSEADLNEGTTVDDCYVGNLCPDTKNGLKGNPCPDTYG